MDSSKEWMSIARIRLKRVYDGARPWAENEGMEREVAAQQDNEKADGESLKKGTGRKEMTYDINFEWSLDGISAKRGQTSFHHVRRVEAAG